MLLENMLKRKQAQQLVQMICYPGGLPAAPEPEEDEDDDDDGDGEPIEQIEQRRTITRILKVGSVFIRVPTAQRNQRKLPLRTCQ